MAEGGPAGPALKLAAAHAGRPSPQIPVLTRINPFTDMQLWPLMKTRMGKT